MSSRLHNWHYTWLSQRPLKFYTPKTRSFLSTPGPLAVLPSPVIGTTSHHPAWGRNLGAILDPVFFIHCIESITHFYCFCFLNISPIHQLLIVSADSVLVQLLIFLWMLAIASLGSWVHSGPPLIHHPYCSHNNWDGCTLMDRSVLPTPRQSLMEVDTFWPLGLLGWWPFELLHNLWGLPLPNSIPPQAFALLELPQAHSGNSCQLLLQAQDEDQCDPHDLPNPHFQSAPGILEVHSHIQTGTKDC